MKVSEIVKEKAGVIPYIIEDGKVLMMFMTPSDAKFGGPLPQIAKGCIDPGETPIQAAVREGAEELGLIKSNILQLTKLSVNEITGNDEKYNLHVFVAKIKNKDQFDSPHFETGKVHWLSPDEFIARGRTNQQKFVKLAATFINTYED